MSNAEAFLQRHGLPETQTPQTPSPEELERTYHETKEWVAKTFGAAAANEYAQTSSLRQGFGPDQAPVNPVLAQTSMDRHTPIAVHPPEQSSAHLPEHGQFTGSLELPADDSNQQVAEKGNFAGNLEPPVYTVPNIGHTVWRGGATLTPSSQNIDRLRQAPTETRRPYTSQEVPNFIDYSRFAQGPETRTDTRRPGRIRHVLGRLARRAQLGKR